MHVDSCNLTYTTRCAAWIYTGYVIAESNVLKKVILRSVWDWVSCVIHFCFDAGSPFEGEICSPGKHCLWKSKNDPLSCMQCLHVIMHYSHDSLVHAFPPFKALSNRVTQNDYAVRVLSRQSFWRRKALLIFFLAYTKIIILVMAVIEVVQVMRWSQF